MEDDEDDAYSRVLRQAVHDAVRAVLLHGHSPPEAASAERGVFGWLLAEHGLQAVLDAAEEMVSDLGEAFAAIASVERLEPLRVADGWYHDQPEPDVG
ncbi:hypothetical protein ACQP04_16985 [Pseudonocardia halophobica]|uniref:hypothetical protein n=1 Tax=Pseudonocardia halophobica TaxID=29401 RepID=UPI003D92E6DD